MKTTAIQYLTMVVAKNEVVKLVERIERKEINNICVEQLLKDDTLGHLHDNAINTRNKTAKQVLRMINTWFSRHEKPAAVITHNQEYRESFHKLHIALIDASVAAMKAKFETEEQLYKQIQDKIRDLSKLISEENFLCTLSYIDD